MNREMWYGANPRGIEQKMQSMVKHGMSFLRIVQLQLKSKFYSNVI